MKKIIICLSCFVLAVHVIAGINQEAANKQAKAKNENYCAVLTDGVLMLTMDNKVVKSNVTFKNGTLLTTDGTVIRKDGTKTVLNEGNCVDKNGNIIKPAEKNPPLKKIQK